MTGNATMTIHARPLHCVTADTQMPVRGSMKVVNFQWPETYGVGLSYQASDKWLLVADYKNIGWSERDAAVPHELQLRDGHHGHGPEPELG